MYVQNLRFPFGQRSILLSLATSPTCCAGFHFIMYIPFVVSRKVTSVVVVRDVLIFVQYIALHATLSLQGDTAGL